jgi:DNA-binding response OmpR family regulator
VKVLLVEDEKKINSLIRKGLEPHGFIVDTAQTGDEGYLLATTRPYDVLILDIMLPGRDGLSILRNLRERKVAVPVILLTARSELNERVEGLNLGADDYLTKPFFIDELIARIHAVTRRASGAVRSILSVSDLTVNLLTRDAKRNDENRSDAPRICIARTPDALPGPSADQGSDLRTGLGLPFRPWNQSCRCLRSTAAKENRRLLAGEAD